MAYEAIYNKEFTVSGMENLRTVLLNTNNKYNRSGFSTWLSDYGFTLIGLAPVSKLAAAAGIASLLYANINSVNTKYQGQLSQAYIDASDTLVYMLKNGYTKCKGSGGAIFHDSGSFVPYNFYSRGYFKNGTWMTDN